MTAIGLAAAAVPAFNQNLTFMREFPVFSNPSGVSVDATGVYSLRLTNQGSGNQVVSLLKYNTRGTELWSRQFISSPVAFAGSVTASVHGIYVAGTGLASSGQPSNWDIFVAKFDQAGANHWSRRIELPSSDFARAIAADDSGVYVAGQREREGVIRKYDNNGVEQWTLELSAPGRGYHAPLGVSVDSTGVYVAGVLQPAEQGTVGFLRKYDTAGSQVWERHFGVIVRGVSVHAGGVYVVGSSVAPLDGSTGAGANFLRNYSTGGDEVWTRHFGGDTGIIVDLGITSDSAAVYVVGGTHQALPGNCRQGAQDAIVFKFDSSGNEMWARQFGTRDNDYARTVITDSTGVYVAGDRFLAKFEKTSALEGESRPRIAWGCVVNAASHLGGGVAPGEIVTILGSGIGPEQLVEQRVGSGGRLATELAGSRILFNGVPAPLLYVSATQSSAVVPYGIAGLASVDVQVEYRGARSETVSVPVLPARPGIFTVDGKHAVALNEDGSSNSVSNPALSGSVITLFATGEGLTSPRFPDGIILGATLPQPASEVFVYFSVSEDDWPVAGEVLSLSGVSGAVAGLLQIQVRVPRGIEPNNALPVSIGVRSSSRDAPVGSQLVTIAVR